MGASQTKLTPEEIRQLQEFTRYSPRKLQQVWNEFSEAAVGPGANSKKEKNNRELSLPEFKKFINTYFSWEAAEDFVKRLFSVFDADGSGTISFKELVVSASVLESGTAEEKLKFLFKVYDEDGNGYLEKEELNKIMSQMCSVSQALGHDTTEVGPVLSDMLNKMAINEVGRISLDEWISGGLKFAPVLVALGVDMTTYNVQRIFEGVHQWYVKYFKKPVFCNVCTKLVGIGKPSFRCEVCKFSIHEACATSAPENCRPTFVKKPISVSEIEHHWVEGNFGHANCVVCKEGHTGSIKGLSGLRCAWCETKIHSECKSKFKPICELGPFRNLTLPYTSFRLKSVNDEVAEAAGGNSDQFKSIENPLEIVPLPNSTPILVFINPASGGNQGVKLLRTFKSIFNPRQVFDLLQGGPMAGLKQFKDVPNMRIICCGGDGTVGWVLAMLDKLQLKVNPAVGVIPLGTGNDLARTLGWGGGYSGDLRRILHQFADAEIEHLDRWQMDFAVTDPSVVSDQPPLNILNNYFSIGVDAEIAHRFHTMREKFPEKFNSRARNKVWYFEFGTKDAFMHSCKNLHKSLVIECDGKVIDLENGPALEGLAIVNIPSMYGGANLWGTGGDMGKQQIDDKKLEVVGLYGSMHVGRIRSGLAGSAYKIAQCSVVKITSNKALPMQTDGEPWMQSPVVITITHKNQMPMLKKMEKLHSQQSSGALTASSIPPASNP